jgi:hypothetical protein
MRSLYYPPNIFFFLKAVFSCLLQEKIVLSGYKTITPSSVSANIALMQKTGKGLSNFVVVDRFGG